MVTFTKLYSRAEDEIITVDQEVLRNPTHLPSVMVLIGFMSLE